MLDAVTAIETLLKELDWKDKVVGLAQREEKKAKAELEQAKSEMDVAIKYLYGHCPACIYYTQNHNEGMCMYCTHEKERIKGVTEISDNWRWRGAWKED